MKSPAEELTRLDFQPKAKWAADNEAERLRFPLGKKLRFRVAKSADKVPNDEAALVKSFYQLTECLGIILIPLLRHFGGKSPKLGVFNCLDAGQNRFKTFPACNRAVHVIMLECSHERQIRKIPLAGVEAIALVN